MPRNTLLLLGRLLIAALFLPSGLETLSNLDGAASYFAGLGLPLPTLAAWGAGLFETVAGVLILVGLQTPIAALLLALFAASPALSAISARAARTRRSAHAQPGF